MLIDASVARSVAVLGWIDQLGRAVGGSLSIAHGVLGIDADEPSELRGIRDALRREVGASPYGSGRYSKAVAAVYELDKLLRLEPPTVIRLLLPDSDEIRMATRLTSREASDREWRRDLGLRARRLDAGEAVSIAIAYSRGIEFASDDGQALVAYTCTSSVVQTGKPTLAQLSRLSPWRYYMSPAPFWRLGTSAMWSGATHAHRQERSRPACTRVPGWRLLSIDGTPRNGSPRARAGGGRPASRPEAHRFRLVDITMVTSGGQQGWLISTRH